MTDRQAADGHQVPVASEGGRLRNPVFDKDRVSDWFTMTHTWQADNHLSPVSSCQFPVAGPR